jgi:hypothetical protein
VWAKKLSLNYIALTHLTTISIWVTINVRTITSLFTINKTDNHLYIAFKILAGVSIRHFFMLIKTFYQITFSILQSVDCYTWHGMMSDSD